MAAIRAEYWIECSRCGQEKVMVASVPYTGNPPRSKEEAWDAAKGAGWRGSRSRPICDECIEANTAHAAN